MNNNLVEIIEKNSMFAEERAEGKKWIYAHFIVGQSYSIPQDYVKSANCELAFTVNKNTGKSLTITVFEKYNDVVTVKKNVRKTLNPGSAGIWAKYDGIEYTRIATIDITNFSRWAKKTHINVFQCGPVNLEKFTNNSASEAISKTKNADKTTLNYTVEYYTINEDMCKIANDVNSDKEYKTGSITEMYKKSVDEAYSYIETSSDTKKSLYLAKLFAKKYAQYINDDMRNEASCPSILVAGPANFPVRKKERQNARRHTLNEQFKKIQALKNKIKNPNRYEIKRDTITADEFESVQYFEVVINEEVNRIQLVNFEELPSAEQRNILKKHGFKWSNRFQAWQRQLTENSVLATWEVIHAFENLEIEEIKAVAEEVKEIRKENATTENFEKSEPTSTVEQNNTTVEEKSEEVQEDAQVVVEKSTKTTTKLTIIQALTNFANRQGYEIIREFNDCGKAGLKVNVIIRNVKYYDYKHDDKYRGYSTIDGTYNSKSKTINLICKDIVVINCRKSDNNCIDKNQKHNIIVESAEQIHDALNNCTSDFDIFFDNFDFNAEDAFSYFKNHVEVEEIQEEQLKEDSEKFEPTSAEEENTTPEIEPILKFEEGKSSTIKKEEHSETATKQEKHSKKSEPIFKNVIDKSKLMKRAWEIKRTIAEEMKVKVSIISMSECLKMAWAEVKNNSIKTVYQALCGRLEKNGYTVSSNKTNKDMWNRTTKNEYLLVTISKVVTMKYYDFKNSEYRHNETIANSYNKTTKTIDVVISAIYEFENSILSIEAEENLSGQIYDNEYHTNTRTKTCQFTDEIDDIIYA